MTADTKAIVRRFYQEIVNGGNMALVEELIAPGFVEHNNPAGSGLEGFKQFVAGLSSAFPDLQITIEDLFAEGDKVAARVTVQATHQGTFMGSINPTGKKVSFSGIDIFQIIDGKIVGRWNQRDLLGLIRQLEVKTLPE
jgi:steroid delta-isomerase-like uncharacterized protein